MAFISCVLLDIISVAHMPIARIYRAARPDGNTTIHVHAMQRTRMIHQQHARANTEEMPGLYCVTDLITPLQL